MKYEYGNLRMRRNSAMQKVAGCLACGAETVVQYTIAGHDELLAIVPHKTGCPAMLELAAARTPSMMVD